jgi:predicted RNase H-like HicB family nuclease
MADTYTVLLRVEPEGGYTVLVPALPGCLTFGKTISEALSRAEEALLCHILGLQDLGKAVPEDSAIISMPAEELTGTILVYHLAPARGASPPAPSPGRGGGSEGTQRNVPRSASLNGRSQGCRLDESS